MKRRSGPYYTSLVFLAASVVFGVAAFSGRWYYLARSADTAAGAAATAATAAATALADPIADAMTAPMHDRLAEISSEQRRRAMLATRVTGVMLGEGVAHLVVDRDPGPLPEAREHLCALAALSSPQSISGRSLTLSVGRAGRPNAIIGAIDC